eukprot:9275492-Karenia_brevis.AAC.1
MEKHIDVCKVGPPNKYCVKDMKCDSEVRSLFLRPIVVEYAECLKNLPDHVMQAQELSPEN